MPKFSDCCEQGIEETLAVGTMREAGDDERVQAEHQLFEIKVLLRHVQVNEGKH